MCDWIYRTYFFKKKYILCCVITTKGVLSALPFEPKKAQQVEPKFCLKLLQTKFILIKKLMKLLFLHI